MDELHQRALTGFDSRQWSDSNSDSQSTDIRFDDCEDRNTNIEPDNVYIQLTKENTFTPDEDRGRKVEYCENTDTRYWGDQPSGNYHFTIIRINGNTSGGRVDVPFVKVWY